MEPKMSKPNLVSSGKERMSDLQLVIQNLIKRWHGNGIFSQIPLRSLINKLKKIETPGIRSLQYWQKNLQLAGNMLLPCDFMSYNGWNDENQIS